MIKILILAKNFIRPLFPANEYPFLRKIYKMFFILLCPNKIKMNGFEIFFDPQDIPDFFTGNYESEETAIFRKIIKSDWVVIDAGANIGYHALELSRLAKKVWAFEPGSKAFSLLQKNLTCNKALNVAAVNKALSDKNGSAFLETGEGSGNYKIGDWGEKVETIEGDFIKDKIDFIKMDIEGHELQALMGMKKILQNKPFLLIEFNPRVNKKVKQLLEFLENYGYKFYDVKNKIEISKQELLKYENYTNLLCN